MKRFGIAGLSILLLSIVGYFGYQEYAKTKLMASIRPSVKNASLRVNNAVADEMKTSRITFKEFFERLEADIAEIDKKILDIQSVATPTAKEKTDVVIAYLKGARELLRVMLAAHRKDLAFLSALEQARRGEIPLHDAPLNNLAFLSVIERVRRALKLFPESSTELSYYKKSAQWALNDAEEKVKELKESVREVAAVTRKFLETRAKASAVLPTDVLADVSIIETFAKMLENDINTERTRKVPLLATGQRKSKGGERQESKAVPGKKTVTAEERVERDDAQPAENLPESMRENLVQSALQRVRDRAEASRKAEAGKEAAAKAEKQPMSAGPAFEFLVYRNQMLRVIRDRWTWVGPRSDLEVTVRFGIRENGEIVGLRVIRLSGDPSYDDSVLRAVAKASPLSPPPENYRKEFMDVELTFRPKDLGG